jgi:hypothetical protein
MNAREQARFDALKRIATFGANNISDFPLATPPATSLPHTLFPRLSTDETGLIDRIAKNAQTQQTGTGTARGGTTSRTVLRDALFLELKGINRTAIAIAEDQNKPEIMDKFRMPYSVSDTVLVAKANAIADAAEPLAADFAPYGHDATFVDDLRAHITAFDESETEQSTGTQTQAGATEGFDPLMKEGMTIHKRLDAFMHNFYRSNAAKLGEWKTASHIERQPRKKKTETPANPAPPKP